MENKNEVNKNEENKCSHKRIKKIQLIQEGYNISFYQCEDCNRIIDNEFNFYNY
jgi:hypothetical protein